MNREEILQAITSNEERLASWKSDELVAMWECEQLACTISALYDELAILDNAQYILEHPEDLADWEEEQAAAAMMGMTIPEYRRYCDQKDQYINGPEWWEKEGYNYNPMD